MASKELKEVRRLITALLSDPRLEDGQRDRLSKWMRKLDKLGKRGRVKAHDVVRPIREIASLFNEVLKL